MAETVFTESSHRLTDPIRFFKNNDPVYYDVLNIPLKQIHENTLWLKDQVTSVSLNRVNRSDLGELQPYVDESDNTARVRSGRYSARINDAYNLQRLQIVTQAIGQNLGEIDVWQALTYNSAELKSVLDTFKSGDSTATFMNGLAERAFAYPVTNSDYATSDFSILPKDPIVPLKTILEWANITGRNDYFIPSYDESNSNVGFSYLATIESHFVKMWRGVTRIAIVDVPEEISIEVPEFKDSDFDYIDESGTIVSPISSPEVRIDLLFIYSKSIDVSSTTISKSGVPTSIYTPELGILKGAGLAFDYSTMSTTNAYQAIDGAFDDNGNPIMLAHPADAKNTALGVSGNYGSYPAPDDLLNLAPILSEKLESTDELLVGQSILPVAYIVVRKSASLNSSNQPILTSADVIDIRPFFRTAELTYNERAGIAAAMPNLSFANPAVGKAQMDYELGLAVKDYTGKIASVSKQIQGAGAQSTPRVVGIGYVLGGTNFGPEGAITDYYEKFVDPGASQAKLNQLLVSRHGYPTELNVPDFPAWDLAKWAKESGVTSPGSLPNDYVNQIIYNGGGESVDFGGKSNGALTQSLNRFGTDNFGGSYGHVNINYVSKTIQLDKTNVEWMADYTVDVELLNCAALTSRAFDTNNRGAAGSASIWVEKRVTEFTIYCAWVTNDFLQNNNTNEKVIMNGDPDAMIVAKNREGDWYAGWAVLTSEMINAPHTGSLNFGGEPNSGVAIYPSITFKVTGIPSVYKGTFTNVTGTNPVITLV